MIFFFLLFNRDKLNNMEEDYITDIIRGYEEDLQKVKQDGYALQYVKEQTYELCLAAVKQEGRALHFVKEQTYELCLEAVKQNGWAFQFVKDPLLKAQLKLELKLVSSRFF